MSSKCCLLALFQHLLISLFLFYILSVDEWWTVPSLSFSLSCPHSVVILQVVVKSIFSIYTQQTSYTTWDCHILSQIMIAFLLFCLSWHCCLLNFFSSFFCNYCWFIPYHLIASQHNFLYCQSHQIISVRVFLQFLYTPRCVNWTSILKVWRTSILKVFLPSPEKQSPVSQSSVE